MQAKAESFNPPPERLLLIGRYDRCLSVTGDLGMVSRVHLLLSQLGPDVVAIDTASTFGSVTRNRGLIETAVLKEEAVLLLADSLVVEWKRRKVALA